MSNVININDWLKMKLAVQTEAEAPTEARLVIRIDRADDDSREFLLGVTEGYVTLEAPFAMEAILQLSPNVARVLGMMLIEHAAIAGMA